MPWGDFIRDVCCCDDLHPDVAHIRHPAAHILSWFQKSGTPVMLESDPLTPSWIKAASKRGPHCSCIQRINFLRKEYSDMIKKQQWIILPEKMIQDMFGLQLSPLGLVPQQDRWDWMISDYSYFDVNQQTLNITPKEAIQFGRTLWQLLF